MCGQDSFIDMTHSYVWPRVAHISYMTDTYEKQHTATHCNTLQHTATHCNTLQDLYARAHISYIFHRWLIHTCVMYAPLLTEILGHVWTVWNVRSIEARTAFDRLRSGRVEWGSGAAPAAFDRLYWPHISHMTFHTWLFTHDSCVKCEATLDLRS